MKVLSSAAVRPVPMLTWRNISAVGASAASRESFLVVHPPWESGGPPSSATGQSVREAPPFASLFSHIRDHVQNIEVVDRNVPRCLQEAALGAAKLLLGYGRPSR